MECEVVLEEWGCASEIKQILNKIKATPCKPAEGVTRKAPEERINFAKVSNFGKVYTPKSDTSELSEGNGKERKRAERRFGEKRLWGGWG